MQHILIFDGAPAASQALLVEAGGRTNADLFEQALSLHASDLKTFTLNVADGEHLPQGLSIGDFDAVVITGSPLNIYRREPAVTRQIELARDIFGAGIPTYGSCWGLQLMCTALGGAVRLNPKGREIDIARTILRTAAGREHALLRGKDQAFDALCSHEDEVETLPDDAVVLARNRVSDVQAVQIERGSSSFWGVQYHPEFNFGQVTAIMSRRRERFVTEGYVRHIEDIDRIVADLQALERDPARRDIAWMHGLDAHVTDPHLRTIEFGNWLEARVRPFAAKRAAAA
jgi:GMP synthase (glutamine-hydrolysing)